LRTVSISIFFFLFEIDRVYFFFSGKRRCQRSRAPLDTGILLKTLQELIQFYRQNAGNRRKKMTFQRGLKPGLKTLQESFQTLVAYWFHEMWIFE
jgi:hypothetical protein